MDLPELEDREAGAHLEPSEGIEELEDELREGLLVEPSPELASWHLTLMREAAHPRRPRRGSALRGRSLPRRPAVVAAAVVLALGGGLASARWIDGFPSPGGDSGFEIRVPAGDDGSPEGPPVGSGGPGGSGSGDPAGTSGPDGGGEAEPPVGGAACDESDGAAAGTRSEERVDEAEGCDTSAAAERTDETETPAPEGEEAGDDGGAAVDDGESEAGESEDGDPTEGSDDDGEDDSGSLPGERSGERAPDHAGPPGGSPPGGGPDSSAPPGGGR